MGSHRGSDIQDQAQHRGQPLSNRLSNVVRTEVGSLFQKHVLNRKPWDTRKEPRLAIVTWIERTYHFRAGALSGVISLTLTGDRIRRIDYVRAPGKLHRA